jgi:peptidoglycan-associated lipoprotein
VRTPSSSGKYLTLKVTIEGHCDERGTRESNMALGSAGLAAKEYLVAPPTARA